MSLLLAILLGLPPGLWVGGTATILYEHPDGKYYPFKYNPKAGPGVEVHVFVDYQLPDPIECE